MTPILLSTPPAGLSLGSDMEISEWGYLLWMDMAWSPQASASLLKSSLRPSSVPKATPLIPPLRALSWALNLYENTLFGPERWSSA